jgi:hypothetical protein
MNAYENISLEEQASMNKFIGPLEEDYYESFPCPSCGEPGNKPCKTDCPEVAYNAYLDERVQRLGVELAMLPDFMECYECGRNPLMRLTPRRVRKGEFGLKYVMRRPIGLGPIAEEFRDPTQMYRLECGHLAM